MSFLYGITSFLGVITRLIAAPFLALGQAMGQVRLLNPGPIFSNLFRTLKGSLVAPFRMLGIRGGPNMGKLGKFFDFEGWRENLFVRDPEKRRKRRVGQIAQFSQIHLVGPSGMRHILHIGTGIGRSTADIALRESGLSAVLRFDRGDLPTGIEAVHVLPVKGETIQHNGKTLKPDTMVKPGDKLNINGHDFAFEMYAWDRVPLITRVNASYATNTGPNRAENEDAIGIYQHTKSYLFTLADGVGGGAEGDQASAYSVQYLLSAFHKNARYTLPWLDVLSKAFTHINAEVRNFARRSPMPVGSTLTAVVVKDFQAYIAHVGDSRVMLWRDGVLRQITTDHVQRVPVEFPTRVAFEMQEAHPQKDVLTRAIGKNDTIEAEFHSLALRPNDILVLLSDGVYDALSHGEIVRVMREFSVSHIANTLVSRAIEARAKDNISAIAFEIMPDPFVEDTWTAESAPRIYTGWQRGWPVKMRRVNEPVTQYPVNGGVGLLWLLATAGLIWLISRIFGGAA